MKKFTAKALVLAVGAVCGGSAFAGSFTTPANDNAAVVYAAEALTSSTAITLPNFVYTMGVGRTVGQDMTIILTPSSGATFDSTTCSTAIPTVGGAGAATITLKRASTTECAYDTHITTAFTTASTLTFSGLKLASHGLATAGNSFTITMALKDPGETSFVDNTGTVSRRLATSAQSVNIYANASDTSTTADVNAAGGPLTGFVAGGAAPVDTATVAAANLTFDNNSIGAVAADGTTLFDFTTTTGTATVVLSGTTSGAAANKFCLDINNNATLCETGEKFTVTSSNATLANIPSSAFPAQGTTDTREVSFQADGTTQLGTSRTFAVSGTINPQVGPQEALADTNSKNASFWVWTANASQLMSPYFTEDSHFLSRFIFLNTGSSSVGWSATCYGESGNTPVNGTTTGTLTASGQTVVNSSSICTFPGNTRGAILFTINAPINTVKGAYQQIDPNSLNGSIVQLTRPYNQANTTE